AGPTRTVEIRATDSNGLFVDQVFTINVGNINEATIDGAPPAIRTLDTGAVSPFATFTVGHPQPATHLTVTVTLDDSGKRAFSAASLAASGFTQTAPGVYEFGGTAAQAQVALHQLVFDPTQGRVGAGGSETTHFTVSVTDGGVGTVIDDSANVISTST